MTTYTPSTMIEKRYKYNNTYRGKVIVVDSSNISRVVCDEVRDNEADAKIDAIRLVIKLQNEES